MLPNLKFKKRKKGRKGGADRRREEEGRMEERKKQRNKGYKVVPRKISKWFRNLQMCLTNSKDMSITVTCTIFQPLVD